MSYTSYFPFIVATTSRSSTPEWTAERLDEEGRRAGKAISWARAARAGEFKRDPYEHVNIEGILQVYSIVSTLFVSLALGQATPRMLSLLGLEQGIGDENSMLESLHIPAVGILVLSFLCSIIAGGILAPQQNRSRMIWFIKGFAGGMLYFKKFSNVF